MGKISVFNYEIFYLDFLEGNLSEENTTLLFAFLDKHPEYKMDDEFLPTLKSDSIQMPLSQKENLKQPLFSERINEHNIEHFLIAQAENLLSNPENEKLSSFLTQNPQYLEDQKQFKAVYLKADQSITYAHKEEIKKKKVFVLWPYISIAASLVLAFLLWNNAQSTRIDSPTPQFSENSNVSPLLPKKQHEKEKKVEKPVISDRIPSKMNQNTAIIEQKKNKSFAIDSLPKRTIPNINQSEHTPVLITYKNKELQPITPETDFNSQNNDEMITSMAMNEGNMINPIEPITAYLEKKTNTIIEYKKQERTTEQPKKLFIKVGQFEFYRKKN